jgi:hypothetical protein
MDGKTKDLLELVLARLSDSLIFSRRKAALSCSIKCREISPVVFSGTSSISANASRQAGRVQLLLMRHRLLVQFQKRAREFHVI